jgi:hypothetical protein
MSKKSGFFYSMLAIVYGLFAPPTYRTKEGELKFQPPVNRFTGGTEITSRGKKPDYPPLHPEEKRKHLAAIAEKRNKYSLQGITWDSVENRFYWASHKLALDHQND